MAVAWVCGNRPDGSLIQIHMAGFNGTVAFIKGDDATMTPDRLVDGSSQPGRKDASDLSFAIRCAQ